MLHRQTEDIPASEKAIQKICDGLRDFRACGFDWTAVRDQVLRWIEIAKGDELDIAKRQAVADAAEKSYREKTAKRTRKPK